MKNWFDRNAGKIFKWLVIGCITLTAYIVMHDAATAERGYQAIGGEAAAFLIPLLIIFAPHFGDYNEEGAAKENDR